MSGSATARTRIFRGVDYRKDRNRWRARIMVNGKMQHIGHYLTEQDALDAYEKRSLEIYGFDRVNEPVLRGSGDTSPPTNKGSNGEEKK